MPPQLMKGIVLGSTTIQGNDETYQGEFSRRYNYGFPVTFTPDSKPAEFGGIEKLALNVELDMSRVPTGEVEGIVSNTHPDRGFGFVKTKNPAMDLWFEYDKQKTLSNGQKVRLKIQRKGNTLEATILSRIKSQHEGTIIEGSFDRFTILLADQRIATLNLGRRGTSNLKYGIQVALDVQADGRRLIAENIEPLSDLFDHEYFGVIRDDWLQDAVDGTTFFGFKPDLPNSTFVTYRLTQGALGKLPINLQPIPMEALPFSKTLGVIDTYPNSLNDRNFGFIRTPEGERVFYHATSQLHLPLTHRGTASDKEQRCPLTYFDVIGVGQDRKAIRVRVITPKEESELVEVKEGRITQYDKEKGIGTVTDKQRPNRIAFFQKEDLTSGRFVNTSSFWETQHAPSHLVGYEVTYKVFRRGKITRAYQLQ